MQQAEHAKGFVAEHSARFDPIHRSTEDRPKYLAPTRVPRASAPRVLPASLGPSFQYNPRAIRSCRDVLALGIRDLDSHSPEETPMKFYDCQTAPSPRRARLFTAEKGLDIETVEIDLGKKEQLSEGFRRISANPSTSPAALSRWPTSPRSLSSTSRAGSSSAPAMHTRTRNAGTTS